MDNNKPAMGQAALDRERRKTGKRMMIKGGMELQATVVGDTRTDRAVIKLIIRENSRKQGSMGCHSGSPAHHTAPHSDGPNTFNKDAQILVTQEYLHSMRPKLLFTDCMFFVSSVLTCLVKVSLI